MLSPVKILHFIAQTTRVFMSSLMVSCPCGVAEEGP